jgi:glycogen synthase
VRVCLLVVGPVADDPRVRRQGDALAGAGHDVTAIGLEGATSPGPAWKVVTVPRRRDRLAVATLGLRLLGVRVAPWLADRAYWSFNEHRRMLDAAVATGAEVVHANDWDTLPVAAAAAERLGAPVLYDSHELAVEESDRRLWRLLFPAYVRRLEGRSIHVAAVVTTVANGIADALMAQYRLRERPTVIRNTPPYQEVAFREPGERITVLYQGLLNPDKGLDRLIASVDQWHPEFRLVLRGYGIPRYEAHLRSLASGNPRIEFAPSVPMTEMVTAASTADIGIHPLPAVNRQTRYALPNKLFEYAMAGLALCVSGAPEMKRVVDEHALGVTFPDAEPATIAAAVNSLDRVSIATYKRNALAAARVLSWEQEQTKLLEIYERLAG